MVQRLYGETEGQTGAFQSFGRDWMSVYSTPFSNHFGPLNLFDFFREGGQTAARNAERVTREGRGGNLAPFSLPG